MPSCCARAVSGFFAIRRKSRMTEGVGATSAPSTALQRGELLHILGTTFGIAVAVGAMIGVGILRAPSLIAHDVPDARFIIALWVLALVHAALEANVIAELGTAMPRAGGPYV